MTVEDVYLVRSRLNLGDYQGAAGSGGEVTGYQEELVQALNPLLDDTGDPILDDAGEYIYIDGYTINYAVRGVTASRGGILYIADSHIRVSGFK